MELNKFKKIFIIKLIVMLHSRKELHIYSKDDCIYCVRAKKLLVENKIPFTEIKMGLDNKDKIDALKIKTESNTFPFIFIGDEFLGGFTELNHSLVTTLSDKLREIGIDFKYDMDDF